MRQFELKRTLFGADITAQVTLLDEGIHVLLIGGERSHVGAVSVADPQGAVMTQQFPTHKDGLVSERWVRAVFDAGFCPATIVVGIHYGGLNREQIDGVVKLTDDILGELLDTLRTTKRNPATCS